MYKIKNPYKEAHIMDLNLMGVHEYKTMRISGAEIMMTLAPLIAFGLIVAANFIPEMSFLAECQNVPGGDVCAINFK